MPSRILYSSCCTGHPTAIFFFVNERGRYETRQNDDSVFFFWAPKFWIKLTMAKLFFFCNTQKFAQKILWRSLDEKILVFAVLFLYTKDFLFTWREKRYLALKHEHSTSLSCPPLLYTQGVSFFFYSKIKLNNFIFNNNYVCSSYVRLHMM